MGDAAVCSSGNSECQQFRWRCMKDATMSKTITTTTTAATTEAKAVRPPSERQAQLIALAMRNDGVTRHEVREVLNYANGQNVPVQTILKNLAARYGYTFNSEICAVEGNEARKIAFYTMREPAKVPAMAKAVKTARKVAKPARARANTRKTAKK
jgi:hypothetical protein